jgi:hypothetical protein
MGLGTRLASDGMSFYGSLFIGTFFIAILSGVFILQRSCGFPPEIVILRPLAV